MKIVGVMLAAGLSSRMGQNKLLLPIGQSSMAGSVLNEALQSDLDHVVIITNKEKDLRWVPTTDHQADKQKKWSSVVCHDSSRGQSYSLKCGLEEAEKREADAVVILLADQPYIKKELINQLIHTCNQAQNVQFVASRTQGVAQPPVLFSKETFPVLKRLQGDRGAGSLLKAHSPFTNGYFQECLSSYMLKDIDTPDEYQQSIVEKRS